MRFIYVFVFLFSFLAVAGPVDSCEQALNEHFPRLWRIDQANLDHYLKVHPEEVELFNRYSALAHFIEDPNNDSIFDWLGAQYFLSLVDETLTDSAEAAEKLVAAAFKNPNLIATDQESMRQTYKDQIDLQFDAMESQGLHGARFFFEGPGKEILKNLGLSIKHFALTERVPLSSLRAYLTIKQLLYSSDPNIHASMEALDGLYDLFLSLLDSANFEEPSGFPELSLHPDLKSTNKIRTFLKAQGQELPKFLNLTLHFPSARQYVASTIFSCLNQKVSQQELNEFLDFYSESMKGNNPVVSKKFFQINQILISEYAKSGSLVQKLAGNRTPKKLRELNEEFLLDMIRYIQAVRLNNIIKIDDARVTSAILFLFMGLSDKVDMSQNRGLEPLIYKSFVDIVLKKRMLSVTAYRAMLRTRLKEKISERLGDFSRSARAKNVVQPDPFVPSQFKVTTRQERLATYVKPESGVEMETQKPEALIQKATESESDLLSQLLDSSEDLNTDRQRLLKMIQPDIPIRIRLKRFGFVYTVLFSKRALEELSAPSSTLPQDFRPWFQAMSMGPARDQGQNGWKKINSYEWKIKVRSSPYRLYGYRDGQGQWHFTHFELEH